MKRDERLSFREGTLWMRGTNGAFVRIELYIPEKKLVKGMSIFGVKKNFLTQRIEAEEAYWTGTKGREGQLEIQKCDHL